MFDADLLAKASDACASAVVTLNACIAKLVTALSNEQTYDKDAVVHLAWLTHQVILIMKEIRSFEESGPVASKRDLKSLFR